MQIEHNCETCANYHSYFEHMDKGVSFPCDFRKRRCVDGYCIYWKPQIDSQKLRNSEETT